MHSHLLWFLLFIKYFGTTLTAELFTTTMSVNLTALCWRQFDLQWLVWTTWLTVQHTASSPTAGSAQLVSGQWSLHSLSSRREVIIGEVERQSKGSRFRSGQRKEHDGRQTGRQACVKSDNSCSYVRVIRSLTCSQSASEPSLMQSQPTSLQHT